MSEQTMVERVARVICAEQSAVSLRADWTASLDSRPFEDRVKHAVELHWKQYIPAARAALAAMQTPTEAMLTVGGHMTDEDGKVGQNRARGVWWMMIDAALSEIR